VFAGNEVGASLVRWQKERALTSPKTSALAFISVLPWRINDGADSTRLSANVGCRCLVKPLRGCGKSFSNPHTKRTITGSHRSAIVVRRSIKRGWTLSNSPKIAPYGSWKSPITSDLIVEGSVGVGQPSFDGNDIYWLELRPKEGGRNVIVKRDASGACLDVNQSPFNARTKVHEYGGGDYTVSNGIVYFSNFSDQRLYRQQELATPRPLTAAGDKR